MLSVRNTSHKATLSGYIRKFFLPHIWKKGKVTAITMVVFYFKVEKWKLDETFCSYKGELVDSSFATSN